MGIVEEIELNHNGWPRFAKVTLGSDRDYVTALQVQPATAPAAESSSASVGCARSDASTKSDCRRHSRLNSGDRVSGSQRLT
jgi:hypothetical protein